MWPSLGIFIIEQGDNWKFEFFIKSIKLTVIHFIRKTNFLTFEGLLLSISYVSNSIFLIFSNIKIFNFSIIDKTYDVRIEKNHLTWILIKCLKNGLVPFVMTHTKNRYSTVALSLIFTVRLMNHIMHVIGYCMTNFLFGSVTAFKSLDYILDDATCVIPHTKYCVRTLL